MAKNNLAKANKLRSSATGLFDKAVADLNASNSAIDAHKEQINREREELVKNYLDALAAYDTELDAADRAQAANSALAAKLADFVTV